MAGSEKNNFWDRYLNFLSIIDPSSLFASNKTLLIARDALEAKQTAGYCSQSEKQQLIKYEKLVNNSFCADGTISPRPFRMSGYIPFNMPIMLGMLWPGLSLPGCVFWQWLNQTHNALINHYNRASAQPETTSSILRAYIPAATTAVVVSIGMTALGRMARSLPRLQNVLLKCLPVTAVTTASVANILLMRRHETHEGIEVKDENGKVVGVSRIAAKRALFETTVSRASLAIPLLLFPPFITPSIIKYFPSKLVLPANFAIVATLFYILLPFSLAVYPQMRAIKASQLESNFSVGHSKQDRILLYNRGR